MLLDAGNQVLIKNYHRTISLESREGQISTFDLRLPFHEKPSALDDTGG
jgi:hypothetical protein